MQKPTRWIRIERRIVESIRNLNSSCWFQVENEQEKKMCCGRWKKKCMHYA